MNRNPQIGYSTDISQYLSVYVNDSISIKKGWKLKIPNPLKYADIITRVLLS